MLRATGLPLEEWKKDPGTPEKTSQSKVEKSLFLASSEHPLARQMETRL